MMSGATVRRMEGPFQQTTTTERPKHALHHVFGMAIGICEFPTLHWARPTPPYHPPLRLRQAVPR